MRPTTWRFALASLLTLAAADRAGAETIAYTGTLTASGTLGADAFSSALVTFELVGDTTGVTDNGGGLLRNLAGSGTVTVAGLGSAALTGQLEAIDNQGFQRIALFDATAGVGLLRMDDPAFASYDLASAIQPPISGAVTTNLLVASVGTDRGALKFASASSDGTFGARLRAVPGPASLPLCASGGLLVGGLRRRSRASRKRVNREYDPLTVSHP